MGYIVGCHVYLEDYPASGSPLEVEVVNYADKRVMHDRIVSLDERMQYILQTYGGEPRNEQRIQWLWSQTRQLEKRLFQPLPIGPEALTALLPTSGLSEARARFEATVAGG